MDASFLQNAFVEDPTPLSDEQKLYLSRWKTIAVCWVRAHARVASEERFAFLKKRIAITIQKIDNTSTMSEYHHCVRVINYTNFLMNEFIKKVNTIGLPLYLPAFKD